LALFEFSCRAGGPEHLHLHQDEWIYILDGDFECRLGKKQLRLGPGESLFIPRNTPHVWATTGPATGRVLNAYQPAATIEDFFRELAACDGNPPSTKSSASMASAASSTPTA
jgi:quercetin dioxygenase-like cupin family protein